MNINELHSFRLSDAVKFHNELNSELFDHDERLYPDVRQKLLDVADDFMQHMGIDDTVVKDITFSGSNAAYTYTPHSDIDIAVVIDYSKLENSTVYQELFLAKRLLFNDKHDIKVHGYQVEVYVQDSTQAVKSLGEYSIKRDRWIHHPTRRRANLDQTITKHKFSKIVQLAELALRSDDYDMVSQLLNILWRYRKAGLDVNGEFGPENLVWKAMRTRGILDQLNNHRDMLHSKELSIESIHSSMDEDYDPNGPPPGPEFKPTMPKGTLRVDVSDVYDWYKLGQHISNLHGLGKHDFGKGPPSTIFSFGDEDTEHKYIKDLENTGLTTTDIDPVDTNQPKWMKRQKVDPTFNVSEKTELSKSKLKKIAENKRIYNDIKPKLIGLSFSDLEKLSESAADDFSKFDKNISKKLNLPEQKGIISNTLNLYSVYRKQKIYESKNKNLSDIEKKLFKIFNSRAISTVDSVKPGDTVSLLMLNTLSVPNDKIFVNLQGFLNPKQIKSITNSNGIDYLYFVDGSKFPETDNNDPIHLAQSWAMTKLFDSYESASKTYLMYALDGEKLSKEIQFNINVDDKKSVAESASGYIPSGKEKNDPRFKTALTVDIKPNSIKKNASKMGLGNIKRTGIPQQARADGKFTKTGK